MGGELGVGVLGTAYSLRFLNSCVGLSDGRRNYNLKAAHCSTFKVLAWLGSIRSSTIRTAVTTPFLFPRTRTPARYCDPGLMSEEVRDEVRQNSEQCEATNAVAGENPGSAAFLVPDSGSSGRGLLCGRDDRGPIFHAKTSRRKDRGAIQYASRLPRVWARQDYHPKFYPRFTHETHKIVMEITGITGTIIIVMRKAARIGNSARL